MWGEALDREILRRLINAEAMLIQIKRRQDTIFTALLNQGKVEMAKVDDVAAAIRANTSTLASINMAATALAEGHSTISDEIAELKAAIEAGKEPDFTAVDQAVADQQTLVSQLGTIIPANTPAASG